MKRIIQTSPEFMAAVLQIRRDKFKPRVNLALITFLGLFLTRLIFESPLQALWTAGYLSLFVTFFLFLTYPKRFYWFTQEAITKKVLKGSRALVACPVCYSTTNRFVWYPEQSVITSYRLTKKSASSFEKRKITTYDVIDHYSSDGEANGYSHVPKKEKYYVETWTEDWELDYKCPKCNESSAIKVRDYMDNGRFVDFKILTKNKRAVNS